MPKEAEKKEEAPKVEKTSATVTYQGGERTYTKEVHGDKFQEYAEEFAAKRGGTVA